MARASSRSGRHQPRPPAGGAAVKASSKPAQKQRQRSSSAEDLMFFPKLRRRAKWVFVLLAIVFAGGFLVFGVGTGVQGTSIGDILNDVFHSGGSDQPSIEDAEAKLAKNPRDDAARLELANAYVAAGRTEDGISALERYVALKPKNVDAYVRLASLYDGQARAAQERYQAAQGQVVSESPGLLFTPASGTLGTALGPGAVEQALAGNAQLRADQVGEEARRAFARSERAYDQLTLLQPDEPAYFLRLGQAAQLAGDAESARAAYQRFLELSPDDASAPYVRDALKQLGG
jgi:tetratricopeptide (TPR) repeat protein